MFSLEKTGNSSLAPELLLSVNLLLATFFTTKGVSFRFQRLVSRRKELRAGITGLHFAPQCGYFHTGNESQRDLCENCNTKIAPDSYGNPAKLNRILKHGNHAH